MKHNLEVLHRPLADPYHAYGYFLNSLPELQYQAEAGYDKAKSYRELYVGSAFQAVNFDGQGSEIISAGNLKPSKPCETRCAEKNIEEQARYKWEFLIGGIVLGPRESELITDISGVKAHTLYPCGHCMNMFAGSSVIYPDTIVITQPKGTKLYEAHLVSGLEDIYREPPATIYEVPCYENEDNWHGVKRLYRDMVAHEKRKQPSEQIPAHLLALNALTHKTRRAEEILESI